MKKELPVNGLMEQVANGGDVGAMARLISRVESGEADAAQVINFFYPKAGRARVIGITGHPGAGKSTLVDGLLVHYSRLGHSVGVLAVDPSSPITKGAVLGDRIRLSAQHREGVYFRSMANRGSGGGLSEAIADAVVILDAAGYDVILIETVGVGQAEIAIANQADAVLLVLTPNSGDQIQAMKAGIMEIADVYAINKADLGGADLVQRDISSALSWGNGHRSGTTPQVLTLTAASGEGIDAVADALGEVFQKLEESGLMQQRRRARVAERVGALVQKAILARYQAELNHGDSETQRQVERVDRREISPYHAAELVLERFTAGSGARSERTVSGLPSAAI